jgi:copper homeostasis protein (lipoprotein)
MIFSKNFFFFFVTCVITLMMSCGNNEPNVLTQDESTEIESDAKTEGLMGLFEGTLPCEDCTSIFVMLSLEKDFSYELNAVYLGKSESTFQKTGTYTLSNESGRIQLSDPGVLSAYLKLIDGYLVYLNKNGAEPIAEEGQSYILRKSN